MGTVKKNVAYSTLLAGANYAFPLAVYPYVSRVLGVENVGVVGFVDSLATYFILFSMMGISILGAREVARVRGARGEGRGTSNADLRKSVWGLQTIHAVMTVVCLVGMLVMSLTVSELRDKLPMLCIGMSKLVLNLFLMEWFWQGMEDFRYITVRTVAVKAVYVAAVFILVRGEHATLIYYFLTMLVVAAIACVNMANVGKYVGWRPTAGYWRRYVGPYFLLGVYSLLTTAYTTFNGVFLGFTGQEAEMGYYAVTAKLFQIIITLFGAVTTVMMPRLSALLVGERREEFRRYVSRSAVAIVALSLPVIAVGEVFAPEIIMLLSGPGYEGAVPLVRLVMPFLLVFGMEQLLVVQVLMPTGRERAITVNAGVAAAVGIALNIVLVPKLLAMGSAIVWVTSETVILLLSLPAVRREGLMRAVPWREIRGLFKRQ